MSIIDPITTPWKSTEGVGSVLAKNLVAARLASGITQRELAERSGVSRATIALLEAALGDPKLSTVGLLAEAMEIPALLLMFGETEVRALETFAEAFVDDPRARWLRDLDLPGLTRLVETGLLKDRNKATRIVARAARSLGMAEGVTVGAAVGSAIRPGIGGVVGVLMAERVNIIRSATAVPAAGRMSDDGWVVFR